MAYDEKLADRVRGALGEHPFSEKKMFGGLCFLLHGNMVCGIVGDELMVRVGKDKHDDALAQPHARPMDFTGRPMRGMVYVGVEGIRRNPSLKKWVDRGVDYADSLPPKTAKRRS